MSRGAVSRTTILDDASLAALPPELRHGMPAGSMVLEHERIPFENYAYEWAPEMLYSAAASTLELAQAAFDQGFRLKDAAPSNIMFHGPRPVFLDVLSFERGDPLDPLWRPYAQFVRTFIYPLLASRYFGLRLDEMLLANRDGLEPHRIARLSSAWRLLLPPFLGAVTMPLLLSWRDARGARGQYRPRRAEDAGEAGYLMRAALRRAGRLLKRVTPRAGRNEASRYMESGHLYTPGEMTGKERVVIEILEHSRPREVLDIGCNTGHFSVIAARHAMHVTAIDRDPEAAGALWRTAHAGAMNILPLVIDFARPPGACGWANSECAPFLERARGRFDCILMLALIHHLLVSERAPLGGIFDLAAELTRHDAIVEYVDSEDAQFQSIARGRDALHRDLTRDSFELAAQRRFAIAGSWQVTATRWIYWLRKGA
ncbi:MAG TPA: class I SAM-dependent methyltransferase [Bryobacteraceae bacterium]|nr:class I SAM-dependent methyltransferase [Bryobacteraceae bacterium]